LALFLTVDCALIITDLLMPVMNGIDLIKAIRKMEITADYNRVEPVPILVITSEKGDLLTHALASGANTHLTKPVVADALERKLQHFL
jgi:CheY-like chemotaxis protein